MRRRPDLTWFLGGINAPIAASTWLLLRRLREEVSTQAILGLRCDLAQLREVRDPKLPTVMLPRDPLTFAGFRAELARVSGREYVDAFVRTLACEAGIQTLFASEHEGEPTYAQWLIRPSEQEQVHAFEPERYPRLKEDEVLLEWAYTFVRFRRLGLMNAGMRQLLVVARNEGFSAAVTYVGHQNVGSLRGCANMGFVLDHVRRNSRRLGRARTTVEAPDEQLRAAWAVATAPRGVAPGGSLA